MSVVTGLSTVLRSALTMSRFLKADCFCGDRAAGQWGVFSREQALEGGHTDKSIQDRVRSGLWRVVLPKVFAPRSSVSSPQQELSAALLWAGPGSMVTGRAAAALYELRSFKFGMVEICSPRRLNPPEGVVLRRLSPYLDIEPTIVLGLATAPIEKALFDLISVVSKKRAGLALDEALRLRLTTLDRFAEFVERIARQGRTGVRKARELIAERDHRHEKVRGPSEIDALSLFDGIRLPVAAVDHEIWYQGRLLARCDFAYVDEKLDMEIDGDSVHTGKTDKDRDRKRDRRLEALGWTVIRFSWEEVRDTPNDVVSDIKLVLKRLRRGNGA